MMPNSWRAMRLHRAASEIASLAREHRITDHRPASVLGVQTACRFNRAWRDRIQDLEARNAVLEEEISILKRVSTCLFLLLRPHPPPPLCHLPPLHSLFSRKSLTCRFLLPIRPLPLRQPSLHLLRHDAASVIEIADAKLSQAASGKTRKVCLLALAAKYQANKAEEMMMTSEAMRG